MSKFHEVLEDPYVSALGSACRALLFLEDVLEDAECYKVYVEGLFEKPVLDVHGEDCVYSLEESVSVFGEYYGVRARVLNNRTGVPLKSVYRLILQYYLRNVHGRLIPYSLTTSETGVEYFLGVLFSGKAFIVEGEENRVVLPEMPVCISAHTHPDDNPYPSVSDMYMLERLLVNRGLGHALVATSGTLVIYREAPLTLKDLEVLVSTRNYENPLRALEELVSKTPIRVLHV